MAETSTKPYMIRALYEWCCDNGYTPYLAASVDEHTLVPRQHVKGGEIVLNVSPMATSRLTLGNELVEFQARFSGVAQQISIPIGNISAIYARETGHGMAFEVSKAPAGEDRAGGSGEDGGDGGGTGVASTADEEDGRHAPGSTVQSLRGGARRRGPRSVELAHATDGEDLPKEQVLKNGAGEPAANARKRSTKGQGSADVLAFTPSGDAGKKQGAGPGSRVKPDQAGEGSAPVAPGPGHDEDPPPADGGGKGGKARLTRVK